MNVRDVTVANGSRRLTSRPRSHAKFAKITKVGACKIRPLLSDSIRLHHPSICRPTKPARKIFSSMKWWMNFSGYRQKYTRSWSDSFLYASYAKATICSKSSVGDKKWGVHCHPLALPAWSFGFYYERFSRSFYGEGLTNFPRNVSHVGRNSFKVLN